MFIDEQIILLAVFLPIFVFLLVLDGWLRRLEVYSKALRAVCLAFGSWVTVSILAMHGGAIADMIPVNANGWTIHSDARNFFAYLLSPVSSFCLAYATFHFPHAARLVQQGDYRVVFFRNVTLCAIVSLSALQLVGSLSYWWVEPSSGLLLVRGADAFASLIAVAVLSFGVILFFFNHAGRGMMIFASCFMIMLLIRQFMNAWTGIQDRGLMFAWTILNNVGIGLVLAMLLVVSELSRGGFLSSQRRLANDVRVAADETSAVDSADLLASCNDCEVGIASEPVDRIFICYARRDEELARRLYEDLKKEGYCVWIDVVDLRPGEVWKSRISREIQSSRLFIALMSKYSLSRRGYVQRELKEGIDVLREMPDDRIFMIPVRVDHCRPADPILAELNWVDLFPDYDRGYNRILESLIKAST